MREAAEPATCGTGRSVAEACASKEPRPGAVESWRRQPAKAHAGCREPPSLAAHDADEWTGREPTRSRPTAWCRAALEPRRSARTPSGRRPSQPPARRLNRTASGPLARLRTAGAAGAAAAAPLAWRVSRAMRNAVRFCYGCRSQACRRVPYLFILIGGAPSLSCDAETSSMNAHALASRRRPYAAYLSPGTRRW